MKKNISKLSFLFILALSTLSFVYINVDNFGFQPDRVEVEFNTQSTDNITSSLKVAKVLLIQVVELVTSESR